MSEGTLLEAAEAIREAESIALACHVGPDGDALGSMVGLGIAAVNAGKKVVASYGSPYGDLGSLSFLPTDLLVPPGKFPSTPDMMIVLDAGSADRLGELAGNAGKAQTLIVLDHHVTNGGFGDISVVDGQAAATGELVFDLLEILGWPVTETIAQCLHTALMTDTGRFTYANTTGRTLEIGAALMDAGADPTEIGRHVYEESPFGYLKVASVALDRAELNEPLRLVSTYITQADLTKASVDWGDIDNLIDTIRLAVEADTAVLAKVHADGRVKVSMRSRGDTNVGGLADSLGGGGHRLAAGFTVEKPVEEVLETVRGLIEDHR
ncbi:MAG: bifunctional oligoribonuclease/PAP phosphatase NrnA [Actinomycetota bacterium]|nr:bifunctional oligoribonuclease/PAP phosphatase NrnA [Actinomycetota bacterium]